MQGNPPAMLWLLLVVLLIAVLGIGTVLEAAFWALLVIAGLMVLGFILLARLVT